MLPPKTWGSDSSGSLSSGVLLPCSEGSARTELTLPKGWAGSGAFTPQVRLREKEAVASWLQRERRPPAKIGEQKSERQTGQQSPRKLESLKQR